MPEPQRNPEHTEESEPVKYFTGPSRRLRRSPGPNIEAYADGAIDRHCHHCGAKPNSFCRHPSGAFRKIPCPTR